MTLIIIGGATATGKSALALDVAEEIGAEIVNADSMQLYKGMDIGTAKTPFHERRGIVHHMLDVLDIRDESSVADYQRQARAVIDNLLAQSIPVVVVGGTGLYIKALVDELNFPDRDPAVRERLFAEAETLGAAIMHQRLSAVDPEAAALIPEKNVRRVIRALEVIELTGNLTRPRCLAMSEAITQLPSTLRLRSSERYSIKGFTRGFIRCGKRALSRKLSLWQNAVYVMGAPRERPSDTPKFLPHWMGRFRWRARWRRRSSALASMPGDRGHGLRATTGSLG